MNTQQQAEAWLIKHDAELAAFIIKQAKQQARGDKQLFQDLFQEGVLCALEAGHLTSEEV